LRDKLGTGPSAADVSVGAMNTKRVGRNERCPCGSRKKYKRCHGSLPQLTSLPPIAETARSRIEAARVQRERQQGLGKPIVSAQFAGGRLVAVKNRLLQSKGWRTFHDFLCDYIKMALRSEWGNAEIAKHLEQRHPILIWYHKLCEHQRTFINQPGKVHSASMTGAVAAYLHLAYDLYALDHNAELQNKLLARLRNRDQFSGARYEAFVAAMLIRAGFDIEFEAEDDRRTTHCEFTASYRGTGKSFSVEVKRRERRRVRIGQLFNKALSKHAKHSRIIFIDINIPDSETEAPPRYVAEVVDRLRSFEGQPLNGQPRPSAYVFITNTPWEHHLDAPAPQCAVVVEGFQIANFKGGVAAASLLHAIEAREEHEEMHNLMESMKDHAEIPSTFDGEIPAYAFNPNLPPLLIGQHYMLQDDDGVERPAELESATVAKEESIAYCAVRFEDARRAIVSMPLMSEEIAAWKRHPDTFFGVLGQRNTRADNPLQMYDFFQNSFKHASKKKLLTLMAGSPDFTKLAELSQPQLASIYAERLTNAAWARGYNEQKNVT
jgi:hypothetical protein